MSSVNRGGGCRRQKGAPDNEKQQQHNVTIAADDAERTQHKASAQFLFSDCHNNTGRVTAGMRQSLIALQDSLTCPLCQSVLVQPVTIPCAHTFCCECIDRYSDNSWVCPSTFSSVIFMMCVAFRLRLFALMMLHHFPEQTNSRGLYVPYC
jgi:Zinc finger, C3HC4 type (RING finger)